MITRKRREPRVRRVFRPDEAAQLAALETLLSNKKAAGQSGGGGDAEGRSSDRAEFSIHQ